MRYTIPDFRDTEEFLALLAQKRGMLKKGGVPDIENMAKLLLCDWTGYVHSEFCFMLITFMSLIQHSKSAESHEVLKKRGWAFCLATFFPLSHFTLVKKATEFYQQMICSDKVFHFFPLSGAGYPTSYCS